MFADHSIKIEHRWPLFGPAELFASFKHGAFTLLATSGTTFLAGGVAGAVSRTCTAPLDRLKTMAQEGRAAQLTMPHPTVQRCARDVSDTQLMRNLGRYIYRHEGGVCGFWRGNGVNCIKAGPEYAIAFSVRQKLANNMSTTPGNLTMWQNFSVGAMAGVSAQCVLYPMELTKTRMAVASPKEYSGIGDCIRQSLRRGGVRDLYRGLCANLAGIAPHRGLEMGMFFTLEGSYFRATGETPSTLPLAAIGIVSSLVAQTCTYPLNLVRTRLQTQGVNGRAKAYNGVADCIATVVRLQGVAGLFVGILPNMLKAVPASTIMYVVFRKTKGFADEFVEKRTR